MGKIIRILVFVIFINVVFVCDTFADTINIPADYATIQEGIDAAVVGDTVLVQPGTYFENINYNGKNITVGSLFLTTADTSFISQTLIDGNQNGSVVTFESGEDSTTVLTGFTIQNGAEEDGAGIYLYGSSPILHDLVVTNNHTIGDYSRGGGIYNYSYLKFSSPIIYNCIINDNSSYNGGGIYCYYSTIHLSNIIISDNNAVNGGGCSYMSSRIYFQNVTIRYNNASNKGGGIHSFDSSFFFSETNKSNIYLNNMEGERSYGRDVYIEDFTMSSIIVDTFTVINPTDYYASPIDYYQFDIQHGYLDSLINSDLFVATDGDNLNSGLSQTEPLKTIDYALSKIYADSIDQNTIHLAPGLYSDSTNGETFPIRWSNYVNLQGSEEDETILDANNTSCVLDFYSVLVALIEKVIIRNGHSSYGGGINCWRSSPCLENVTITGNSAGYGGGIYCKYYSSPTIINSIISDNTGNYGIYVYSGNPTITYSDFYNNQGGNFYGVNDSIGVNVTTNANGDSCDVFYNIQLDPLFADPLNGDYHLSWANFPKPDSTMSPCIDAGDPTSPLDPDGTIADMGAYYFNQNVSVDDPQEMSNYMLTNYPNPISSNFNDLTVSFSIHKPGKVKIQLFNIKGQLVSTLINEEKNIGDYTISHPVNDLPSGIYFTKLSVDGVDREIKKVVLLR